MKVNIEGEANQLKKIIIATERSECGNLILVYKDEEFIYNTQLKQSFIGMNSQD